MAHPLDKFGKERPRSKAEILRSLFPGAPEPQRKAPELVPGRPYNASPKQRFDDFSAVPSREMAAMGGVAVGEVMDEAEPEPAEEQEAINSTGLAAARNQLRERFQKAGEKLAPNRKPGDPDIIITSNKSRFQPRDDDPEINRE